MFSTVANVMGMGMPSPRAYTSVSTEVGIGPRSAALRIASLMASYTSLMR
jgi:hypothetical protein